MTTVRELRKILFDLDQDAEVRGDISIRTKDYIAKVWEEYESDPTDDIEYRREQMLKDITGVD